MATIQKAMYLRLDGWRDNKDLKGRRYKVILLNISLIFSQKEDRDSKGGNYIKTNLISHTFAFHF